MINNLKKIFRKTLNIEVMKSSTYHEFERYVKDYHRLIIQSEQDKKQLIDRMNKMVSDYELDLKNEKQLREEISKRIDEIKGKLYKTTQQSNEYKTHLQQTQNQYIQLENSLQEEKNKNQKIWSTWKNFYDLSIDNWQNFLIKNSSENINQKVNLLVEGMDSTSKETAIAFLTRLDLLYKMSHYEYFLINIDKIFESTLTNWEREQLLFQESQIFDQEVENVLGHEKNGHFLMESCRFHNGLLLIPDVEKRINNKIAIDGGAFIGDSAYYFSKNYNFHQIISFEPDEENFKMLKSNIQRFSLNNVISKNVFLDNTFDKNVVLQENGGHAKIQNYSVTGIQTTSIDKYLSDNDIFNIGVIKLDVEGKENDILQGAVETIKKYKPILLIAIYHNPQQFFETKDMLKNIRGDYSFQIRHLNLKPFGMFCEYILLAY